MLPKPEHVLLPVVFYSARTGHANNIVCQGHQHVMYTSLSAALGLLHRCRWSLLLNMLHTNSPVTAPFPQNRVSLSEPEFGSCFGSAVLVVFEVPGELANIWGHPLSAVNRRPMPRIRPEHRFKKPRVG